MRDAMTDGPDTEPVLLSPREADVVRLIAAGLGYRDIADRLGLSRKTVRVLACRVGAKLPAGGGTTYQRIVWFAAASPLPDEPS